MSRKLLAGATSLLLVTALLSGSAMAGQPGARPVAAAKGDVTLTHVGAATVPFARQKGLSSMAAAKPARSSAVPSAKLQSTRKGKLESGLADKLAKPDAQTQKFDVLVATQLDADTLRNAVRGMEVTRTFSTAFSGFAARLTAQQIRQLQGLAQVQSISLDQAVTANIDAAEKWTGVQKAREDFRITGDRDGIPAEYSTDDVVIAIIDTGIDTGHKDLAGKVVGWADMINGESEPYDDYGHGTHVAGIAAGAGVANRSMRGVAPGAALVGVKVLDENGSGSFSSVIGGIEWVIDHKEDYNIRVLNMSLGAQGSSDGTDPLSEAVNSAVESGIVAVVAAGNMGPDAYTISTPAAAERAITACAMRDPGELGWSLAPWSSRGPTLDGRIKPDICAPGYKISAPKAGTESQYVAYSGTSMATPFVAGVAALMLQINPFLSPDEVKQILTDTAQDWGPEGQDIDYGYGRIDAYEALKQTIGYRRGAGPVNPTHAVGMGDLTVGIDDWYQLDVNNATQPLAATLVLSDDIASYYDLDLYLYDADGNEVASSWDISRQETINLRPLRPGTYYLLVTAYEGQGPYSLDVSWGDER